MHPCLFFLKLTWQGAITIVNYDSPIYEDVLWAKKSDKGGVFRWLPLKQHLVDVCEVMCLLWEHWLSDQQRRQIINSLSQPDEEHAKKLVGFLGAVHDIGKATPAFQSRPSFSNSRDLDGELLEKLERAGFTGITTFFGRLMDPIATPHGFAGQVLLRSYGVSVDVSSIVGGHHGKPPDSEESITSQLSSYGNNFFQEQDQRSPIHRQWKGTQRAIFEWALTSNGFGSVTDLPRISQPGQVLLNGLLIMADWIASNERYFPLIPVDQYLVADPQRRIETGWLTWYRTAPIIEVEHKGVASDYKDRFGFEPRDLQVKLFEAIEETRHPGIVIVEAPMGLGKTEAALICVEQLSRKTKASGMFFGLPTQATSNGMFDRISAWLERLSDEKKSLQLVHGKAALNDSYGSLPRSNIYDEADGTVVVNAWFTGRKTAVLDDFVVGTVDQFLMTALKQKHLALRHLGFSRKVVVIDEVHAYDAYMGQYLYRALRWMGAYNVPVIILSATLPAKTRTELIKHYMRGRGVKWREVNGPPGWQEARAYPLVTWTDGMAVKQFADFETENRLAVPVVRLPDEELIGTLSELLEEGGVAGIVVNTVRRAQEIAELCSLHFGEDLVELLHSNFIATDRVQKEASLVQAIGKNAERPRKKVIVGTQVMEQSLDIDFDVLFSDLAPMDLLLQRLGRLHRHVGVRRPKAVSTPMLFVLGTSDTFDFEPGFNAIYGDYLLMRTQLLLPDSITLPDDIAPLVQAVYSEEEDFVEEAVMSRYNKAKAEHESRIARKESRAKGFLLDSPSLAPDENLIGWLDSQAPFSSEERAAAQVRDTQETIEVVALKRHGDGYTLFGGTRDLSLEIHDPAVQKEISRQTLRLPLRLSAPYRIDQTIEELEEYNKRHLAAWQESDWLKGMLGVIFDENDEFCLNGFRLKYSPRLGLTYQKITSDGGGEE